MTCNYQKAKRASKMGIQYFENKEKQTVYAVLTDCAMDVINMVNKVNHGQRNICPDFLGGALILPDTFRVAVKCDPKDEYDFEIGKEVAKIRVLDKYNKAFSQAVEILEDVADFLDDTCDALEDYIEGRMETNEYRKKKLAGCDCDCECDHDCDCDCHDDEDDENDANLEDDEDEDEGPGTGE